LGKFHAQLGKALTIEEINALQIANNPQAGLEKETEEDVARFLHDTAIPHPYKQLVKRLYEVFNETTSAACLGLCHNDSHHENILLNEGKLACIIDFGDSCRGDVHSEFARYVQDYPQYAEIIIRNYEQLSGQNLCRERILALTILETVDDLRTEYLKNGRMELIERLSPWLAAFTKDQ
jgi:thiamine kinase-like enzyme